MCKKPQTKWATKDTCKKCYNSKWHKSHPNKLGKERHYIPKIRFKYGIRSAKARIIEWHISFTDFCILLDKPCYYCNNQLGTKKHSGSGLDRIDNSKGYEISNVLPCCDQCNKIRNTFLTVEEMKVAIGAVLNYRKLKGQVDKPGSVNKV